MATKPTDDLFEKSTMTFGEHLEELRVCLFRGVVAIVLCVMVGFFVANWVVRFFQRPLEQAMERYYISKALGDFKSAYGDVPVEVQRQIVEEGLIPEPIQVESGQIAEALRITYPRQFGELSMSPYWFTRGDFLPKSSAYGDGERRLPTELVAGKKESGTPRGRIWQLLTNEQRASIERLSDAGGARSADDTRQVLEALNDLAGKRELHESPELASISVGDADLAGQQREEAQAHDKLLRGQGRRTGLVIAQTDIVEADTAAGKQRDLHVAAQQRVEAGHGADLGLDGFPNGIGRNQERQSQQEREPGRDDADNGKT